MSGEKQSRNNKSQRQGSPGLHVEKEEVSFDNPFNQMVSPLTINPNRFCFSANMDEDSELAEKVLHGISLNFLRDSQSWLQTTTTSMLKVPKSTKNLFFLKMPNLFQTKSSCRDLFKEINPDFTILESTFYPSGNIKFLPKTTNGYLLINNYTFSNMLYRPSKNHMSIEESTNLSSNSMLCLNKVSISTILEEVEEAFIDQDITI